MGQGEADAAGEALFEEGRRFMAVGDLENAIKMFRGVIALNPAHSPSYLNLGIIYTRKGEIDQAIEVFRGAIRHQPELLEAHLLLGQAYAAMGLTEKAVEEAKVAIAIDPDHAGSHYVLGLLYQTQGLVEKAIEEYRIVLSLRGKGSEVQEAEKRLTQFKEEADAHFEVGIEFLRKGDLEHSQEAFQKVISLDPDNPFALYNLATIASRKNRLDAAAILLNKALEKKEDFFSARLLLGETYEKQRRIKEAILEYQTVLSQAPDKDQEKAQLARRKLSQIGETLEVGRKVQAHIEKGVAFLAGGNPGKAEIEFLAVLSLLPEQVFAHFNLGRIALKKGEAKAAEARFLRTIEIDPSHYPSHLRLGSLYEKKDQIEEAIRFYKKAGALRPREAPPHLRLGVLLEKQGLYKEAVEAYRKVLAQPKREETPEGRRAKGRVDFYEKRYRVSFTDTFLTYDSNRNRSRNPESELSSNIALGLTYYLRKTPRFLLPLQVNIQNRFLHRTQLFFLNEGLSLSAVSFYPPYTFLQSYRLRHGFSGGSETETRSTFLSHTFSGEIVRLGTTPSQIVLHYDYQRLKARTNPIFDATRQSVRLGAAQNLQARGYRLGRPGLSYTFLDNNIDANDQANRSHAVSLTYERAFTRNVTGNLGLTKTYTRFSRPDSLALSEGTSRRRRNILTTYRIGLTYRLTPGLSLFARYLGEENKSNLSAAAPIALVSLNSGQAASLGAYRRTLVSFGATLTTDLKVPYPTWNNIGKRLTVGLTTGYYRPALKGLNSVLANSGRVIIQDPNHLLPSNPDFLSESRNMPISKVSGDFSVGIEAEWEISQRHSLVFSVSEWQNASIRSDMVPLLLSPNEAPLRVPRSARYNLTINHFQLAWRYSIINSPEKGRMHLNIGLVGGVLATLTIDSLIKVEENPIGNPFASFGSTESKGRGFTTRFGIGGEFFLLSWLSVGLNVDYIWGNISKLKVKREFPSDFRLIPAGLPGISDSPCFRQVDTRTEGETVQVIACERDQVVEGARPSKLKLSLDGFDIRGAIRFHFGRDPLVPTVFERFWKRKLGTKEKKPLMKNNILGFAKSRLSLDGSFKNETAYRINEPVSFTKSLNLFRLNTRYMLAKDLRVTTRVRAFYDAIYDLIDIDTISPRRFPNTVLTQLPQTPTSEEVARVNVKNSRNVDMIKRRFEIREIFFDIHLGALDLRIGRQIVRWGVVQGSRVTDELNPFDFSEFILREVEDRFIPLMMVKADFSPKDYALELVWITEVKPHKPAPQGTEFEQFQILPGFEPPQSFLSSSLDLNIDGFKNSEAAGRLLKNIQGWELSFSAFYTWDDFPASFRAITGGTGGGFQAPLTVNFVPRQTRLTILGTTLSKSFGKIVLNSEFAYTFGKHFGTLLETGAINSGPTLGELKRDFIKYAVGLDFSLFGTDLAIQLLQQGILNWERSILQDKIDTVAAFFGRKTFLNDRISTQMLILYFINEADYLLRPRMDSRLTDRVQLRFGADFFLGDRGTRVGEFDFIGFFKDSNRLYLEVIYSF